MKSRSVNIEDLKSVKNFALKETVTPSYIYKLAKEHKLELVDIDGIKFVDTKRYPIIPTREK